MKNILLLHGWNYRNYTMQTDSKDAWNNRKEFSDLLQRKCNVYKINFPGFCHQPEPVEKQWGLDDYAKFVNDYIINNHLQIDYVLGYSFGGAVAVRWKYNYTTKIKLILISPAIIRNSPNSKIFMKTPDCFNVLRNFVRDIYVIYIIKTNEMRYGTRFLRNSYQEIVRKDLRVEIDSLAPEDLSIILGKQDKQINPNVLYESLKPEIKENVYFINDGGHNIAATHARKLLEIISNNIE